MPSYTTLRMWQGTTYTYSITAVDDTANTVTISGDHTRQFYSGRKFVIGAASGDYSVLNGNQTAQAQAVLSGGDTVITIAAFSLGGTSGSMGSITSLYPLIDLAYINSGGPSFTKFKPAYNTPGATFPSRTGLKLRVVPANTTDLKRFCHTFQVEIPLNFFDQLSYEGTRFQEWLYNYAMEANSEFTFFMEYHGINPAGAAYTEKRAFKGYMEDVPGWMYGDKWAAGGNSEDITISFTCTGDGTYTDWEVFSSTSYRSRT